jgi:hypothetical protein
MIPTPAQYGRERGKIHNSCYGLKSKEEQSEGRGVVVEIREALYSLMGLILQQTHYYHYQRK